RDDAVGGVNNERPGDAADEISEQEEHAERGGREEKEKDPGKRQPAEGEAVQAPDEERHGEVQHQERDDAERLARQEPRDQRAESDDEPHHHRRETDEPFDQRAARIARRRRSLTSL